MSRRETRFLSASVTTAACNPGPNADLGTSRGSSARVRMAHPGQHTPCSRCSLTLIAICGSSATWCRQGSAPSTSSDSSNTCAHDRHRPGQCSTTPSTRSSGSSRRYLPSCPGWPPRPRSERVPPGRGGADGGSCDGGSDELRELRFSRRSSSTTRASSRWFASTSSPTRTSNVTAVSRPPSRIASASARSTPQNSPPASGSLPRVNAYCKRPISRDFAEPSDGLEPSTPSLPWRFESVTRLHARSLATRFLLQIRLLRAQEMRRKTSRVSILVCPFCVRASLSVLTTKNVGRGCD